MKMFKKLFFISFFLGIFALATNVSAMTPTLSVSPNANDSSSVQLTVVGDSNAGVILYYYSTNANGPQEKSLGTTNSSGSLITNILGLCEFLGNHSDRTVGGAIQLWYSHHISEAKNHLRPSHISLWLLLTAVH